MALYSTKYLDGFGVRIQILKHKHTQNEPQSTCIKGQGDALLQPMFIAYTLMNKGKMICDIFDVTLCFRVPSHFCHLSGTRGK
jgi:hypothetical protein